MMIAFGVLGYFLRKGVPAAPLVLAIILGGLLERSLQKALQVPGADPTIFIDKPISAALLAVALPVMLIPLFKWGVRKFLA